MIEASMIELHQLNSESAASIVRSLDGCTTVVLVVKAKLTPPEIAIIARGTSKTAPRFVAAWGPVAEALHDAVDKMSHIMNPGREPITVFDEESTLEEFLWHVAFPYKGLDDSSEETRTGVVSYGLDDLLKATLEEWVHSR